MAAPARSRVRATCYAAAGIYTVSLTVTGPGGSNTQTRTNYVTVTDRAPVAQFTGSPDLRDVPADGRPSATPRPAASPATPGPSAMAAPARVASPSHVYAAAGIYTVSLTVTGPGGSNTQTRSNYVTVTTAAPVAQFTGSPDLRELPAHGDLHQHARPAASPATPGPSAMAAPARWRAPSHVYAAAGIYTVSADGHRSRRQQHANAQQLCDRQQCGDCQGKAK